MPLPDLIEMVPLAAPVTAEITVPGSKSITNRALVLAALANGETTLEGALWSEDTQVMVECLQELGFMVNVAPDPNEACNRTITVYGQDGHVPRGGTESQPLEMFVGNAGTAARFLTAMVCLGSGVYRLHGVPRMHERPQAALFQALRQLGYRIDSPNDRLPAMVHGGGPKEAKCRVSLDQSSQFASALILSGKVGRWRIEMFTAQSGREISVRETQTRADLAGTDADSRLEEELPYVAMTSSLRTVFPRSGGRFQIEPDASSGSYFWAWGFVQFREALAAGRRTNPSIVDRTVKELLRPPSALLRVASWPTSNWQIDAQFPECLPLPGEISRARHLGDSIMTAVILAPFSDQPIRFTDLGRLRLQECERVVALRTELTRCGAQVLEHEDTLTVFPSAGKLHGAEIETYQDHRMAMSFAILGLKVPGIKIKNPACVKKTFPNFFQKLAAPPPHGLGATILDTGTGRPLSAGELFAD